MADITDPKMIYCYWCFGADDNTLALTEGCICEANCGNEWCKHFEDKDSPAIYIDGQNDDTNMILKMADAYLRRETEVGKHNKVGFVPKGRTDKCIWCDTTEKAGHKDCICTVDCGNVNCPKKAKGADGGTHYASNGTKAWTGNGGSTPGYSTTSFLTCSKDNRHGEALFEWNGIKFFGDKKYELEKQLGTAKQPKRLVINCSNSSFSGGPIVPSKVIDKAPAGFEALTDTKYIWSYPEWSPSLDLAWSDGKAFPVTLEWWEQLLALIVEGQYEEIYCCCVGGHGRTGTALAILMMLTHDFGKDKKQMSIAAENWIKANYCTKAIETEAQQKYLDWIADMILAKEGKVDGEAAIVN